jgi:heme-degrading monooxygenase HmoA
MVFVSVTRLRLRKLRFLPGFTWFAIRSSTHSKRADGNLQTVTIKDRGLVFWTITLWKDQEAMRAFRNSGDHKTAMPKLTGWCDEATYVHWEQSDNTVPDLKTAYDRLVAEGVVSKVRYPSVTNATRVFPIPRNVAQAK